MRKTLIATAGALVAILITVGVATAAKPSSSLSLVVVGSPTGAGAVQPSYGDTITFDVSTTQTSQPNVNVRCYQGSAFVLDGWGAFWPGALVGQNFTLSSSYWTGGAADCTADLVAYNKQGRAQTLASLSFHVNA
jgi:hypothetical protein